MKANSFKRVCAGLLAVIMLLSMLPLTALAQDTDSASTEPGVVVETDTTAVTEAAQTVAAATPAATIAETVVSTVPAETAGETVPVTVTEAVRTLAADTPDDNTEESTATESTEEAPSETVTDAATAAELEAALNAGSSMVRITADFPIDRTFYITSNVTVYSEEAHTLTRAADFAGDVFVVGEAADGTACAERVTLTLGNPASDTGDLLTIDGNSENMTVDVVGTVIFVCSKGQADLYENLTITNCKKVGNERTHDEAHAVSYPDQIGGAAGILAKSAVMNIYGGTYSQNIGNDATASTYGGAFFNFGTMNVYGGLFEDNHALRAGVFYNYRTLNLYNAEIKNNSASSMGGAIYMPASTGAFLYIGEENEVAESSVLFSGNTAAEEGGAIFGQNAVTIENAVFSGNTGATGGAAYISKANTTIRSTVFEDNESTGNGGALYLAKAITTVSDTVFEGNSAVDGGALAHNGQNDNTENVELMMIDVQFLSNTASSDGGALALTGDARAYARQTDFTGNSAGMGGAFYVSGSTLELNISTVSGNSSTNAGGAVMMEDSAAVVMNAVTASDNSAGGKGGVVYSLGSQLDLYNSTVKNNTAASDGGAMYLYTGAVSNLYNTVFHGNKSTGSSNSGGALFIYTSSTNTLIHSCQFTNNSAPGYGGALQISGVSLVDIYNTTATGNSAKNGGFMYETKAGTIVTVNGLHLFGNTATVGGPIIWGNTLNAKLFINKNNYTDMDATGPLDADYWAAAIVNKLTVSEIDTEIPEYTDYETPAFDEGAPRPDVPDVPDVPDAPIINVGDVNSSQTLEEALANGQNPIRIISDFEIDRTFYITRNVTIYSDEAHTLTRAADFAGDVFVVGKTAEGAVCSNSVVLTLGDEVSAEKDLLVINGNSENMTADVTGSVLNICGKANVNIHENLTVTNCRNTGDGAVAVLSGTSVLNVYGGTISGSTAANGGAVFNAATVNIYGGTWSGNTAENGGALYNTGKLYVHSGVFASNNAVNGGAVYSTGKFVSYGGSFEGNTADNGGALYVSGEKAGTAAIANTVFTGNKAARNGGAVYLASAASMTMDDSELEGNRATNGGAVYINASSCEIRSTGFTKNISDYYGGAIALFASSDAALTDVAADGNTAVYSGGFLYSTDSNLTISESEIKNNTSDRTGGALSLSSGSTAEIREVILEGNEAATYGGALYVTGANLSAYDIQADSNSAANGGVLYETGANTVVTLDGMTVSGNTASAAGPVIYGGSTQAVLNINKSAYVDSDVETPLDEAYWSAAIANKLTVNDITESVPEQPGDEDQDDSSITNACDVTSAAALEAAINANEPYIRITQDFTLDRTFYITSDITIFSTEEHTLTRDENFAGDIFVIGEDAAGNSVLNSGGNAKLTLGDPASRKQNMLVIDGNKDNMKVPVTGSILFISYSSNVDLHENVTIQNAYKAGNERACLPVYDISWASRIGGSMAIVMSGQLNIYGGIYKNHVGNDEDTSSEETRIGTLGGAIFNYSNLVVYGGTFENNQGARGGVIYNYRIAKIFGGTFKDNRATVSGGVIYAGSTAACHTLIGSEDTDAAQVAFTNNTAAKVGGAIYSGALSGLMIYGNASFRENVSDTSNGGAIYTSGQMTLRGAQFYGNRAFSKGGAIYICNDSNGNVSRFVDIADCDFTANTALRGGAITLYASTSTLPEGGLATVTNCKFISNTAAQPEGSTSIPQGGALYVGRKSELTMSGCTITNNTCENEGGAIIISGESTVKMSDTTFTGNSATGNGGAISIHSADLSMDGITLNNNRATGNGGALYISYSSSSAVNASVEVTNSDFNNNESGSYGGAVYVTKHAVENEKRILTVRDTNFYLNTTTNGGGAMALMGGSETYMRGVTFLQNSVTDTDALGGAIYSAGSSFELDDAIFTQNSSNYSGGAIGLEGGATAVMNRIIAASNNAKSRAGFAYTTGSTMTIYSSSFKNNSSGNGGVIQALAGSVTKIYDTVFDGNKASNSGGAIYAYTNGSETLLQNCTMTNNHADSYGGAIYASNASVLNLYNNTAKANNANYGGVLYATTANTTVTVNGLTVSGNTAAKSYPIILGNNAETVLNINKTNYTDLDAAGELDDAYWASAAAGKMTINEITDPIPSYAPYVGEKLPEDSSATQKDPVSVNDVFDLATSSSDADINETYAAFPKLDNHSNFMSRNTTAFENICGGTVTVDTFVSYKNKADGNGQVGLGLLIFQAMLYKQANPDEEVYIDVSAYRFSTQCAVNINRNSRYFGYMRDLQDREYDEYGFVRIAYLLVSAAKMGIHVTAIGQLDGYPRVSSALSLNKYFTYKLNDPCDPAYTDGVIGDYLNFQFCYWTLDEKGGTDMMHTKMCAVSDYLDMNGVAHQNAVWTSSSNIDGITPAGYNANNNIQTSTIVSDHAELYRVTCNYLRLIADYCGQEDIFKFQDIVNTRSEEQIRLIESGQGNQIPADQQIVYLGGENDDVFELYFTPLGGGSNVWDTTNNPYCKYLQAMYDSEDYILFTWGVPTYGSGFPLGQQIEKTIISAFHDNKNPKNKIYMVASSFDTASFDDLEVGVDIGYKSFNNKAFGGIHNKDVQVSYVQNGQRYFVTLHNSLNFHSGSMAYPSNFFLIVKEKTCAEDSVFSTFANLTTSGDIAAHSFGDWTETLAPTETTLGEETRECTICGKKEIRYIDEAGNVVVPSPSDPDAPKNPFVDVTEDMYYYAPVLWAFNNGITTGSDATHFNPTGECTRAQAVTFLWRAAGEPEPHSSENPFKDVAAGAYYYKAVLWAVEQGITNGMSADTFAPDASCTRGQIVTFLWRYGYCPEPANMNNPFSDTSVDEYYGKAMLWAVEQGITNGFPDGSFGPNQTCTRDQIVTFLYRAIAD